MVNLRISLFFALAKEGHQVCRRRDLCLKFSFVLMSICECKSDNMKGKEGEGELCVFRALLSIIFVWKLSQKIIYSKTFTSKDYKEKHLFLFEVHKK